MPVKTMGEAALRPLFYSRMINEIDDIGKITFHQIFHQKEIIYAGRKCAY